MMKKIGIMLYTLLAVLVLVSCSSSKKKKEETDKGIKVNIVDEIKFDKSYDDQMEDVPFDNPNMYQSTYMDVDPDFAVTVESTSRLFSSSELASSVSAKDSKGQNVSLNVHSLNDAEKTLYEIKAAGGYKPGDAYTIELPNVDTLLFEGKSPEIRKILFTVKEEEKDNAKLIINYTNYDFNKVTQNDFKIVDATYCDNAGSSGTAARHVLYNCHPDSLTMYIPKPYTPHPLYPAGALDLVSDAEAQFTGVWVKRPKEMLYIDVTKSST